MSNMRRSLVLPCKKSTHSSLMEDVQATAWHQMQNSTVIRG